MTPIHLTPASEADLEALAARLHPGPTARFLAWRLNPPAGQGWVALGPEGSAAAIAPDHATRDGREIPIYRFVAAAGDPLRRAALVEALRDATSAGHQERPLLAVATAAPSTTMRPAERIRTWITGPDPFIGAQRPVDDPDATHDALARSLPDDRWRLRRDAEIWRWRLGEPDVPTELIEVPGDAGPRGVTLLRERRIRGVRTLEILDLQALDRAAHYDLLKAARRRAWDRGGLPVVLRGEEMSRGYAFTAGYLPSGPSASRLRVWLTSPPPGPWSIWGMDG